MTAQLDETALVGFLQNEYGFTVGRLTPMAKGEVGCNYSLEAAGERYFLKVYPPSRQGKLATRRLDFSLGLARELYMSGLFRRLPCPLPANTGNLRTEFRGWPLAVFSFIEGKVLSYDEDAWAEEVIIALARTVAAYHGATSHLEIDIPFVERFDIPFETELAQALLALEQVGTDHRPGQRELRDLLLPRRAQLGHMLARLKELAQEAQRKAARMVLCHTDLNGANIIMGDDGELYVVDWEGACLAPPEQDLFFFADQGYSDLFLDEYERVYSPVHLDSATFGFYYYRRNLEDLTDWMVQILYENTTDVEDAHDLEGIQEDCLQWWPELEDGTIKRVEARLRRRRQAM